MKYNVCLLRGDGIGPLICSHAEKILAKLGGRCGFDIDTQVVAFGKSSWTDTGDSLPEASVETIRSSDGALLFGLDSKGMPGTTPLGKLRKALGLYAEVRAVRNVSGCRNLLDDVDMVFVREITEGFLADRNMYQGNGEFMPDAGTAVSMRVITYDASLRIARFAFDYAKRLGYKRVTAIHKASILKMTCGLFLKACREVAAEYDGIDYEEANVDDTAGEMIRNPEHFGVIVTTNMFGDILSDEGAALVNGRCVGINIGEKVCVFLPVQHEANYEKVEDDSFDVVPSLMTVQLLLRRIGETAAADLLEKASDSAAERKLTGISFLEYVESII